MRKKDSSRNEDLDRQQNTYKTERRIPSSRAPPSPGESHAPSPSSPGARGSGSFQFFGVAVVVLLVALLVIPLAIVFGVYGSFSRLFPHDMTVVSATLSV